MLALEFKHALPVAHGISLDYNDADTFETDENEQTWKSLRDFQIAATFGVLEKYKEGGVKNGGFTFDALVYEIRVQMQAWTQSALCACCDAHPKFRELLKQSQSARLKIDQCEAPGDVFSPGATARALYELREQFR